MANPTLRLVLLSVEFFGGVYYSAWASLVAQTVKRWLKRAPVQETRQDHLKLHPSGGPAGRCLRAQEQDAPVAALSMQQHRRVSQSPSPTAETCARLAPGTIGIYRNTGWFPLQQGVQGVHTGILSKR